MAAIVTAVSCSKGHTFSKPNAPMIRLVAGLGVEGDAHLGKNVQHLYAVWKNPDAPNLRQVHLMHEELFDELRAGGFSVQPGAIGENVTTRGLDLLALPAGARLRLGAEAVDRGHRPAQSLQADHGVSAWLDGGRARAGHEEAK